MEKKLFSAASCRWAPLLLAFVLSHAAGHAQNVSVSGASTGNGSYATLASAFSALNGGSQTSSTISISILGNTTETVTAVLNAGTWDALSIQPSGTRTITGNLSGGLVDLNGADNLFINGINSSTNSLTFSNTNNGSTYTFRLRADATSNTITNCTILGSTTSSLSGIVSFTSPSSSLGNSNNFLSACKIGPVGTNYPTFAVYGIGSSGSINENNTISGCEIFDFFNMDETSGGINIAQFNSRWTIHANRFYQTTAKDYTNTSTTHYQSVIGVYSGNGYTITNNIVGYASAASTGSYAINTNTNVSSQANFRFMGIDLTVGTATATSVQGNTLTALDLGAQNSGMVGVEFIGGKIDISNNIFGGSSGTNHVRCIALNLAKISFIEGYTQTGTVTVQNNVFGGATCHSVLNNNVGFFGVYLRAKSITISGNIIGNNTPNNIQLGSTSNQYGVGVGIFTSNFQLNTAEYLAISGNTLQNILVTGQQYTNVYGIQSTESPTTVITGNIIRNLQLTTINRMGSSTDIGAAGIVREGGSSLTIAGNTVSAIHITGSGANGCVAAGICESGASSECSVIKNVIYDISNAQGATTFSAPSIAAGIYSGAGSISWTTSVANNFVSLGNGNSDNTCFVGIFTHAVAASQRVFHNTININGTVTSGSQCTFGYFRGDFGINTPSMSVSIKNNLINNSRTGGSGMHFAISNDFGATSASTVGWGSGASDYNVLNSTSTLFVGTWGSNLSFSGWQTASGGDSHSYSGIPVTFLNPANDLHLNMGTTPTFIESQGTVVSTVTTDIDGQTRPGPSGSLNNGAIGPDIGADEIDGVPIDVTTPVISYTNLPSLCTNSERTLAVVIADFIGVPTTGSLQPRIYFRKNSGAFVSSQGTLSSGNSHAGNWNFTISNSAIGGVADGDIISYFVTAQDIAQTVNIGANPSTGFAASDVNNVSAPPTIITQTYVVKTIPTIAVNSGSVCSGDSFTIVPSGAPTFSVTGNTFTVSPNSTTVYYVTGTSSLGCASGLAVVTVSVFARPNISVNGVGICAGDTATILPNGANTYTITGNSFTVAPSTTTSYSVTGTATNGCISSSAAVSTISVYPIPTISVSDGTICAGASYTIIPGGASTYSINGNTFTVSPSVTTSYSVSGTSAFGCISQSTIEVTVKNIPVITANGGSVCEGTPLVITPTGAVNYTMTVNSATLSGIAFTVSPNVTSTFVISGTSTAGCIGTGSLIVVVNALPNLTLSSSSATLCSGDTAVIAASGADSYWWNTFESTSSIAVSPVSTTTYIVVGTAANGCDNIAFFTQYVDICNGVSENSQSELIRFFPNPTKDKLFIESRSFAIIHVSDISGRTISTHTLNKTEGTISLEGLANGLYFIKAVQQGKSITFRIIKE